MAEEPSTSTSQFNILVTGGVLTHPPRPTTSAASIRSTCHANLVNENLSSASLFVSTSRKEKLLSQCAQNTMQDPILPNTENLRQLATLLNSSSTYLDFRSHLFNDRLLHPATIFTFSKYPTTSYGMSISYSGRLLSEFFGVCASCILHHDGIITRQMTMQLEIKLQTPSRTENAILLSLLESLTMFIENANDMPRNILLFPASLSSISIKW